MRKSAPTTTAGGVARLPRTALRRRLTRIRAGARATELDQALAAGADPWSDGLLLTRAGDLLSRDRRMELADALERVLWAAVGGGSPALGVRLRRHEVYAERDGLITLAELLRAPAPIPVPVVASLSLLVTDGASPLFIAGGRDRSLSATLRACLAAVELPAH
jgi:hypothetical protein